ncbi:serine hydrolase [Leeuwenhoekiella nanhaiensis]|uniref:beta-lactamase n=1 Tax=Leeuwenhoekiella nanhaiensis TaxID=1655491 RepID=A0A2G1VPJ1_9FLAO|nr:serine hydrolase [Leeuwenhoekiella nanhaiensis]PHQ28550.1 hypothetical protein CJ305_14770 [Leeuwenhoekiella nanhaiensis]
MRCIWVCCFTILVVFTSCKTGSPSVFEQALQSSNPKIKNVMQSPAGHEIQILYTEIKRDSLNRPQFTEYAFNLDEDNYFYPASTVKLPVLLLALEKLSTDPLLRDQVDLNTPYKIPGDTVVHQLATDLVEIIAVSDNEAYNHLFEFLGRDSINALVARKRLGPFQINHRLSTPDSDAALSRGLVFYPQNADSIVVSGYTSKPIKKLNLKNLRKGKAYMQGDSLVEQAFDFSAKNYFPLRTQQEVLKRLLFENAYTPEERFQIKPEYRDFLLETMPKYPRELGYDPEQFPDGYVKFFVYGDTAAKLDHSVAIFNKVGDAYGTLTDNAFIQTKDGVEFLLSATLLVNENATFNDDTYEYEELGLPFLGELGREILRLKQSEQDY